MADSPAGSPTVVALIPAKGESKRILHKNARLMAGHPLIAYSIAPAIKAGIFTRVVVSTDDPEMSALAQHYGASIHMRDPFGSRDSEPDIAWVRPALLGHPRPIPDAFMILRPTTPFRTAQDLRECWETFLLEQPCDSIRAVRPIKEHPGKMWVVHTAILPDVDPKDTRGVIGTAKFRTHMTPLFPFARSWDPNVPSHPLFVPWHSNPTQMLPELVIQTAALEVAWTYNVLPPSLTVAGTHEWQGSISGSHVRPIEFADLGMNVDLNTEDDWEEAERLIASGQVQLPEVG